MAAYYKTFLPMLSEDKIISIFCFVDDLLKGIGHLEDSRRRVSDSESNNHSNSFRSLFWADISTMVGI